MLEAAGARIYSREKEIVYAGGDYLMWHTTVPGVKSVPLEDGRSFTFEVKEAPATVVLDLVSGELVLE
jgi:hypothetical protein